MNVCHGPPFGLRRQGLARLWLILVRPMHAAIVAEVSSQMPKHRFGSPNPFFEVLSFEVDASVAHALLVSLSDVSQAKPFVWRCSAGCICIANVLWSNLPVHLASMDGCCASLLHVTHPMPHEARQRACKRGALRAPQASCWGSVVPRIVCKYLASLYTSLQFCFSHVCLKVFALANSWACSPST